ncbi:MAG: T9SS type A sorting domain-containing protein [Bacteroidota bacterium]
MILCSGTTALYAQSIPFIDVTNATAKQGDTVSVRVAIKFGDRLPASTTSTINLRLSYPPNRLAFKEVTGGTSPGGCMSPTVVVEPVSPLNGNYAFLTVSCSDVQRSDNDAIFMIYFRVLAGQDTLALIEPRTLILNSDTVRDAERSPGVIKFDKGEPLVFPTYPEGLFLGSSNPFLDEIRLVYIIDTFTPVRFKIFDHLGRIVFEDDLGTQERGIYNYSISTYKENTRWLNSNQSSGMYIVIMETNSGVYRRKLMFLK